MFVWPGCIRYGFPLLLIGTAHSALLLTSYEFISDEIQGVGPCEAKPFPPNKSFTACKKEIYIIIIISVTTSFTASYLSFSSAAPC